MAKIETHSGGRGFRFENLTTDTATGYVDLEKENLRILRDALTKALGEEAITLIVDGPRPGTWNNLGDCAQALVGRSGHEVKLMRDTCDALLGVE